MPGSGGEKTYTILIDHNLLLFIPRGNSRHRMSENVARNSQGKSICGKNQREEKDGGRQCLLWKYYYKYVYSILLAPRPAMMRKIMQHAYAIMKTIYYIIIFPPSCHARQLRSSTAAAYICYSNSAKRKKKQPEDRPD